MDDQEVCPTVDPIELEQMIRQRAFELFLERAEAAEDGTPESDWLTAALEIQSFVNVKPN